MEDDFENDEENRACDPMVPPVSAVKSPDSFQVPLQAVVPKNVSHTATFGLIAYAVVTATLGEIGVVRLVSVRAASSYQLGEVVEPVPVEQDLQLCCIPLDVMAAAELVHSLAE